MKSLLKFTVTLVFSITLASCNSNKKENVDVLAYKADDTPKTDLSKSRELSQDFKDYWYEGTAEITSYRLTQERYGELREGTAVTIFVTEDFLADEQVKADRFSKDNIPVLKFNSTKKYLTGIYPYSIMTSTFSPVYEEKNAIKISHSMQEWCGQVYVQLNNRKKFEIEMHSYFQGEADQNLRIEKTWQESDLWNRIRINPEELPTGEFSVLPSFEYFRTSHQKIKAHTASARLMKGDSIATYTLSYPTLKRELKIYFSSKFPYTIERWEETHANGLTSKASKINRIKAPYWGQNSNQFLHLRDTLGL